MTCYVCHSVRFWTKMHDLSWCRSTAKASGDWANGEMAEDGEEMGQVQEQWEGEYITDNPVASSLPMYFACFVTCMYKFINTAGELRALFCPFDRCSRHCAPSVCTCNDVWIHFCMRKPSVNQCLLTINNFPSPFKPAHIFSSHQCRQLKQRACDRHWIALTRLHPIKPQTLRLTLSLFPLVKDCPIMWRVSGHKSLSHVPLVGEACVQGHPAWAEGPGLGLAAGHRES